VPLGAILFRRQFQVNPHYFQDIAGEAGVGRESEAHPAFQAYNYETADERR